MKGMWESDYTLLALFIIFFLLEVQADYDERCENPRIPLTTCGKGKFRDPNGECQNCPYGQFQDAVNHVCGQCKNCTKCDDGEISKDWPNFLCLAFEDTTCIKVNDTTTPKSDGTSTPSTSEGPFSSSPKKTNSDEILKSTTQATAGNITTPGSAYIQEEKHNPYKTLFYVLLVLLVLVVIVLGGIIWWQRKKLKNGQHLAGNQLGQNGSGAGQNGSGAGQNGSGTGQNGSGTGQNGSETEMTNMLANGHV